MFICNTKYSMCSAETNYNVVAEDKNVILTDSNCCSDISKYWWVIDRSIITSYDNKNLKFPFWY